MVRYLRQAAAAFQQCLALSTDQSDTVRARGVAWCSDSIANELVRCEREIANRGAPMSIEGTAHEVVEHATGKEVALSELMQSRCEVCKEATTVKCSRCKVSFFCSRKCQKEGWYSHKPACATKKAHRENKEREAKEQADALEADATHGGDFDFNGRQRGCCTSEGCDCSGFVRKMDDLVRMVLHGAQCVRCGHGADLHHEVVKRTSCTMCACPSYRHRVGAIPAEFRDRICHMDGCRHPFSAHETDETRNGRHTIERTALSERPGPWRLSHMAGWMAQADTTLDYKALEEQWRNEPPALAAKVDKGPIFRSTQVARCPFSVVQLDQTDEHNKVTKARREVEKRKKELFKLEAANLKALENK